MANTPNHSDDTDTGRALGTIMLLHLVCCGFPIVVLVLISAGLTIDVLWRIAPYLAIIGALVGVGWFIYSVRRRCWTCSTCDANASGRHHSEHAMQHENVSH
jgi:F0F1-type ATP synthase assembly protein I